MELDAWDKIEIEVIVEKLTSLPGADDYDTNIGRARMCLQDALSGQEWFA